MSKKRANPFLGIFVAFGLTAGGFGQTLSQSARHRIDGQPQIVPGAKIQLARPRSLRAGPALFHSSAPIGQAGVKGNPGGLPGIDSLPNFTRAFRSQGQVWPYTIMGNDPALGRRTRIPARIIAVSLELQNADLVTTTKVPIAHFERLALNSPNFEESDYSSGEGIQFADAVQRAEFFHAMKKDWHTELHPARIVEHVTIFVPRTIKVPALDENGNPTEVDVRTYLSGTADDGNTFVLLLDRFFDQAFFDTAANAIGAGHLTTDALNIVLLPNTFLFSLEEGSSGTWRSASIRFSSMIRSRRYRSGLPCSPVGFRRDSSAPALRT